MFGLSIGEIAIIAVVALLVFGPEKLPELFRQLGKISGELKKTSDGFRREFYNAVYTPAEELARVEREARALVTAKPPAASIDPECPDYQPPAPPESDPVQTPTVDKPEESST